MKHKFYWIARELVIKGSDNPSTSCSTSFIHFCGRKLRNSPEATSFVNNEVLFDASIF